MKNPYEPPSLAPLGPRAAKPALLPYVTVAMVVCAPSSVLFDANGLRPELIAPTVVILAVSYFCLWHFWNGKNWARWLVMLTSGVGILNLGMIPRFSAVVGAVLVFEAALSVFLLVWLNLASTKAYFVPAKA